MIKFLPYMQLARPRQWLKNLMLYFPPFLGGTLFQPGEALRGAQPFAAFCMVSSATYIVNDVLDGAHDHHHPEKRKRPIPSGRANASIAGFLAVVLTLGGFMLAWTASSPRLILFLAAYLIVSLAYSLHLKHVVIMDIFCISAGFLLRLYAGGTAFDIPISDWLFLTVFLLSVFLSTGKRLSEKNALGSNASHHRKTLLAYPQGFLEGMMYMTGGSVLVTYTMYVITRHSTLLMCSVPLCCFGLLRYTLRILSGGGGDPTDSLLRDLPLFLVGLAWTVTVGWGIYAP